MGTHKAGGITVLALTLGRIAWRLGHTTPPLPGELAGWERTIARGIRWVFYELLLIMPLTGWAMVSARTKPRTIAWLGLFEVTFLPVPKQIAGTPPGVPATTGPGVVGVGVLHTAGA